MEDAKELGETFLEKARELYEESKDLVPVAFLVRGDNHIDILAMPWEGNSQKKKMMGFIYKLSSELHTLAFILTDSWVKKSKVKEGEELWESGQGVEHCPGREEALTLQVISEGVLISLAYQVHKEENGKVVWSAVEWLNGEHGEHKTNIPNAKEASEVKPS